MKDVRTMLISMALLCQITNAFAFQKQVPAVTVVGIVSDEAGLVKGAAVSVSGNQTTTTSDIDGMYAVHAKKGQMLTFSFPGNKDVTVAVTDTRILNVTLQSIESRENTIPCEASPAAVRKLTEKAALLSAKNREDRVSFGCGRPLELGMLLVVDGEIAYKEELVSLPADYIVSVGAILGAQGAALYGADGVNGVVVIRTKDGYTRYADIPQPDFRSFTQEMLQFGRLAITDQLCIVR
ncbi:MAG TPA: hypothetical protein VF676_08405 [Flavobacterium sp.]